MRARTNFRALLLPFCSRCSSVGRSSAVRSTTYFFLAIVSSSRGRLLCSLITSRSSPHNPSDRVLAYVFGRREDQAFLKLKALLEHFGIRRFYTDGWGTYRRHLDLHRHVVGKRRTQQLERRHPTLRTRIKRLVRKTICFSRSVQMHEIVIGLFINRLEFGVQI